MKGSSERWPKRWLNDDHFLSFSVLTHTSPQRESSKTTSLLVRNHSFFMAAAAFSSVAACSAASAFATSSFQLLAHFMSTTPNPQERWGTHKKRWPFQPCPFADVIGLVRRSYSYIHVIFYVGCRFARYVRYVSFSLTVCNATFSNFQTVISSKKNMLAAHCRFYKVESFYLDWLLTYTFWEHPAPWLTLPETNMAPENTPGPKRKLIWPNPIGFRCYLTFRECILLLYQYIIFPTFRRFFFLRVFWWCYHPKQPYWYT